MDRAARTVSASDIAAYRDFVREYVPESTRADHLSAMDHEQRPRLIPGYDRVLAASDGHTWAQVYESDIAAPHDWDVFDPQRRFAGQVRVLAGLQPLVVTDAIIVGVWRDGLGVEHVCSYRLIRP